MMVSALHDEAVISFFILILQTQFLHCLFASERLLGHKEIAKERYFPENEEEIYSQLERENVLTRDPLDLQDR